MSDHNAGVISFGITASNKKGKHSMGISASQYGNIMEKYDRTRTPDVATSSIMQ